MNGTGVRGATKTPGQMVPNGFLGDNYPRNMCWVAARGDEITENPLARWILEMPVLL